MRQANGGVISDADLGFPGDILLRGHARQVANRELLPHLQGCKGSSAQTPSNTSNGQAYRSAEHGDADRENPEVGDHENARLGLLLLIEEIDPASEVDLLVRVRDQRVDEGCQNGAVR